MDYVIVEYIGFHCYYWTRADKWSVNKAEAWKMGFAHADSILPSVKRWSPNAKVCHINTYAG